MLAGNLQPLSPDSRISLIKEYVDSSHPNTIQITELARKAYLSQSRFRALFKEQIGISFYKYILWSKIRMAIQCIVNGRTIRDAAWEAGFVDSSLFHKTLLVMFGISPSQFVRNNKSPELHTCPSWPHNFKTKVYDSLDR